MPLLIPAGEILAGEFLPVTMSALGRSSAARPPLLIAGVVVVLVLAVVGVALLPLLPDDAPKGFLIPAITILSVLTAALCWPMWQLKRWAYRAQVGLQALSGLLAVPGVPSEPLTAGSGVVAAIVVCGLLLAPSVRRAFR